ncbi:MAG: hypothetical protein GAK35_01889 [Herbaspirillum frisingense]|uniref:Type 4 fimbrial biogenesis protein PilX N-terminal domain-containing protein n=1 Tax=Herbaspirillum frisingense TaxID=92645 RepID=A0A7V8FX31_9BURK|nr:MAG: hypothetical protein GAK35_01889 [Herbaspirillum frisingense]
MIAMPARQRGATLMIALIMLTAILLLGTASASLLILDEHTARNHRVHVQATLAAQAALDDACEEIRRADRIDAAAFPSTPQCRSDVEGRGLCLGSPERAGWKPEQLSGAEPGSAAYGEFTGRRFPSDGDLAAPRYLIEWLASDKPGRPEPAALYRISAIGFGRGGARAGLQAIAQGRSDEAGRTQCIIRAWRPLFLSTSE